MTWRRRFEKNDRLAPPLMYAFRAAHRERDAAVPVDIRDQGRARHRFAARRRRARRSSESELRKLVNSDLVALLNTTNLEVGRGFVRGSRGPQVRFSISDFPTSRTGRSTRHGVNAIAQRDRRRRCAHFEPRLAPEIDQGAARRQPSTADELRVRFLVSAELRVYPVNVPIEFVAEVEVDSGKVRIDRL